MALNTFLQHLLLTAVTSPPVLGQDVFLTNRRDASAIPFAQPQTDVAPDSQAKPVLHLDDAIREAFLTFKSEFGRDYAADSAEHATRFATFRRAYMLAQGSGREQFGAQFGLGKFADATPEEMRQRMGFKSSDLNGNTSASGTGLREPLAEHWLASAVGRLRAPAEVDWVAAGAVTPIKDQGQCGGCWAFSATGALEGAAFVESGILTSLSEQEVIDCDNSAVNPSLGNSGCQGGSMEYAFIWAHSNNVCVEEADPYKSGKTQMAGTCDLDVGSCNGLVKGCVSGYRAVQNSESDLMTAVAKQPVSVAIQADSLQTYLGGVFSTSVPTYPQQLDHGVLVVGYGATADGTAYWMVKNSWGKDWGEAGYFRLARGTNLPYGTLGLLAQPVYPEVVSGCTPGANSIPFWSKVKRWTLSTLRNPVFYVVAFGLVSMCGLYCVLWNKCCCRKRLSYQPSAAWPSANQQPLAQSAQGRGPRLVDGVVVR